MSKLERVTDRALASCRGDTLAVVIERQKLKIENMKAEITALLKRAAIAEQREGDAGREIERLKRLIAELKSQGRK